MAIWVYSSSRLHRRNYTWKHCSGHTVWMAKQAGSCLLRDAGKKLSRKAAEEWQKRCWVKLKTAIFCKSKKKQSIYPRSGASAYVYLLCCTSAFRSSFPTPWLSSATLVVINWILLTVWRFQLDSEELAWFWKCDVLTHYLNPHFSMNMCLCVVLISDILTNTNALYQFSWKYEKL